MVFLLWNRILAKAGTILEEEWSSMNYEEARAYLDDAARYGSVLGLDTMKELLARLGNPQDDLKIHSYRRVPMAKDRYFPIFLPF